MRSLILFLTLFLVVLVSSTPINPRRILINRPDVQVHKIIKRYAPVKGANPGIKDIPSFHLRKGEYVCGNRICKLKPGEIPKNCNGVCQYPVAIPMRQI